MKWKPPHFDRSFELSFGERTFVMGILNTSPDSFSGDGVAEIKRAVRRGLRLVREGADIIDVGGQSTRPGSREVSIDEEIRRTSPVIEKLASSVEVPISIDTYKSEVAQAALSAGASIVNDISGFRFDRKIAKVAAEYKVPVILMHIRKTPATMQKGRIFYRDVIRAIKKYLKDSIEIAKKNGVDGKKIIIDPGIGFGKTVEHNLEILRRLSELKDLKKPILVGTSRKSMIGKILDLPVNQRLEGTAATVAVSIANGADIIRVHDVKQMKRVAVMTDAIVRIKN
ncbi:MAG: dihydropteroate synthase [Elusimicrobia bacterium]|nr:dihydropteroate synthase [Elusimicrobiota bacterium]